MSDKRTPSRKRPSKVIQDGSWNCSVCTFSNTPEAFKCMICDVRKGTSTRKPKLNQHIVAQQEATRLVGQMPHSPLSVSPKEEHHEPRTKHTEAKTPKSKLKDFDRSNPITLPVTVNDVTFMFTEYRQKEDGEKKGKHREKSH